MNTKEDSHDNPGLENPQTVVDEDKNEVETEKISHMVEKVDLGNGGKMSTTENTQTQQQQQQLLLQDNVDQDDQDDQNDQNDQNDQVKHTVKDESSKCDDEQVLDVPTKVSQDNEYTDTVDESTVSQGVEDAPTADESKVINSNDKDRAETEARSPINEETEEVKNVGTQPDLNSTVKQQADQNETVDKPESAGENVTKSIDKQQESPGSTPKSENVTKSTDKPASPASTPKNVTQLTDTTEDSQSTSKNAKKTENVDIQSFLNSKNTKDEELPKLSDDEIDEGAISSSSESGPPTSPEVDSGSDSDYQISSDPEKEEEDFEEEEEDGDAIVGPIVSKNEQKEVAPVLPPGFTIPPNAPIELVGKITGLVDNSVIIEANVSGEFRTLKESSIFCFEDRSIVGPLFETFGRLQNPRYRVKFNTVEQFEKYIDSVGRDVYYVVPESDFVYTDTIKNIKGTDASNCHDEELPEEEQEFSDDEHEAQAKNKRKKKNKRAHDNFDESKKRFRIEPPLVNKFQPYGYPQPQPQHQPQPPVSTYTPISKSEVPPNMHQIPQTQYPVSYSPSMHTPHQLPPQVLGGNYAPQLQNPNYQQPNYAQQPPLQNNFQLNDGYASPYGIPLHQAQQHGIYPPQQPMYSSMNIQQQHPQGYPQQIYQQQYQQPYQQQYNQVPQRQHSPATQQQYSPAPAQMIPHLPPNQLAQPMHQMGNFQPPYPQPPPK